MALTDHGRIVEKRGQKPTDRPTQLFAATLFAALMATLGLRSILPLDALAPAIATLLLAVAAATAGVALLCRRHQARSLCLDVAGVLAFVGITVSILIEPDQMVRLVTLSNPPD